MNYEKVMCYVRTFIPKYNYEMSDFMVCDDCGDITLNWNFKNIPKPTLQDLEKISETEVNKFRKRREVKSRITVVDELEDIENPKKGDVVIFENKLWFFSDDKWTS